MTSLVTDVHTASPHSEVLSVFNGLTEADECDSNDSYVSDSSHYLDEYKCLLCHHSFQERSEYDRHLLEHVQQPTIILKRIDVPKTETLTRSFARKHIRPYKNNTKINVDVTDERYHSNHSPIANISTLFNYDDELPMVPKLRVLLPEQLSEQVDALENSRFSCSNSPIDDSSAGNSHSEIVLPDTTLAQHSRVTGTKAEMVELSALPGDSQSPGFPSQSPSQPDRLSQHHHENFWAQDENTSPVVDPLQLHDINGDHRESGEKEAERHDSLLQNFLNDSVEPTAVVVKETALASNETEFISLDRLAGPQCSTCGERFVDQAAFSEHCKSTGHYRTGGDGGGVSMSLVPYGQSSALQHMQHPSPLDSLANLPMQQLAQQVNRLQQGQVHQQNVLINIQQFGQPMAPPPYRNADMSPHMQPHISHYPPAQQPPPPPPHHHHMYGIPPHQSYHPHGPPPPPPHGMYYGAAGASMYGPPPPPQQPPHHPLGGPPPPRQQSQPPHQYHHRGGGGGSMMPPRLPPPSQQAQRMTHTQVPRGVQQQQQQQQHFRTSSMHAPRGGGRGGVMGPVNRSAAPQQPQQIRSLQQQVRMGTQMQNGKRPVSTSQVDQLQAKKKRLDVLIPDTNDDADCHVISMQTCKDGLPVIKNVQGAATSVDGIDPVVHLTDSITLSVRNPKEVVQGAQQQQQQQKKNDAKAVANILATRGITVTPASKPQKEPLAGATSSSPACKPPTPVAINLNSAVSIIPTARGQSSKSTSPSCGPVTGSSERTAANSAPPTVDLTDEGPGQKTGGKRSLPHQCDLCPAQYPNMRTLMIHRRQYHKAGPQSDLGVPIVDLSQTTVLSKLASLGIHSYIPLPHTSSGSNGTFALPIVSVNAARNPNVCNIGALGSGAVLTLGPLHHISNLSSNRQQQ